MKLNRNILRRPAALVSALALVGLAAVPIFATGTVSAVTNQVTSRSITMSDSTQGATNVTYAMTITIPDAAQSMVVDFCGDSPIIGGACNATNNLAASPDNFTAAGAAYSSSAPTNANGTALPIVGGAGTAPTGWSKDSFTATTLKLTSTTPTVAGTTYTFYFTGITNQSVNGTFYARVYTYSDNAYGSNSYTSPTVPGTYKDYGGFALSTANNVSITAVVMESLTFCVSKTAPGAACGSTSIPGGTAVATPALTLGHGTPKALDTSATDSDTAFTQLSTNALHGAVVTAKTTTSTTCAGLSRDGGSTCDIAAQGTAGGTIPFGTAKFGLAVGTSTIATNSTTGTGTVAPTTNYGVDPTTNHYYLNPTGLISDFGDTIESTTGACQDVNNQLTYGASVSATTPAGVYSTTQAMIATGTF